VPVLNQLPNNRERNPRHLDPQLLDFLKDKAKHVLPPLGCSGDKSGLTLGWQQSPHPVEVPHAAIHCRSMLNHDIRDVIWFSNRDPKASLEEV
jgi:hypothetical protein